MNSDVSQDKPKRGFFMRLLFGLIWFFFIRFVANFFIGAILGFTAGFAAGSPQAGSVAGRAAALQFFTSYGLLILLVELLVTAVIGSIGLLPGTGKFKSFI